MKCHRIKVKEKKMKKQLPIERASDCPPASALWKMSVPRLGAMSLLAVLSLPAGDAKAVGFRLPNQDPEAIARGNAFVATADNPSAIYYNPAGITQLEGQNVSAGLYLISTAGKFEATSGATAETDRS